MARLLSLFTVIFLIASLPAISSAQKCAPAQFRKVKRTLRSRINQSPDRVSWPARLLRAGFHDCLPGSCDGSLQFELRRGENSRLDVPVRFLKQAIRGTCVSLADAIKIGMALSMELSGGPKVTCKLGTKDATRANRAGQLALAGDDFRRLLTSFTTKGFTERQAIAANYGGHSLGGFVPPGAASGFSFTPKPNRFNNRFCKFIAIPRFANRTTGFNALPSDTELASRQRTLNIVRSFARRNRALRTQFQSFMNKLCKF